MKSSLLRILLRIGKIGGIATGSIVLLLFLLPYLFPGFVSNKIRQWARGSIRSELNFSSARLSFFRHFPALTLTLYDVKLKGSAPFEKETLIEADEIALGVDLRSVFSEVDIDKIFLTNAFINIQVDPAGHANYNIYISKKDKGPASPSDSGSASLKILDPAPEMASLTVGSMNFPTSVSVNSPQMIEQLATDLPFNAPWIGWLRGGESPTVETLSNREVHVIAADTTTNLTVHSGATARINRSPYRAPAPALENKVYVTVTYSDGDNLQYVQNWMRMSPSL